MSGQRKCSSAECEQQIVLARTQAGRAMPVDVGSAGKPGGNLAVWKAGDVLMCRVLGKTRDLRPGEFIGTCHWSTCIAADDFRGKAGWWHNKNHRRWEWRTEDSGPPLHWIHDAMPEHDPAEQVQEIAMRLSGGERLPDEAWAAVTALAADVEAGQ